MSNDKKLKYLALSICMAFLLCMYFLNEPKLLFYSGIIIIDEGVINTISCVLIKNFQILRKGTLNIIVFLGFEI